MKNYWCEKCNYRWVDDREVKECPNCGEKHDFRQTMSKGEALERGLIGNNTIPGDF